MFFFADKPVEQEVNKIIKQKQKFERMVVTKEEALELFADNPFKVEILTTKVADGTRTTVYKCGDLIDLCRGPHLAHTGKVKAFAATRHSATNWLGDTDNDSLQRMYGISFPDKKLLKTWKENMEKVRAFKCVGSSSHNHPWGNDENRYNLILGFNNDRNIFHLADSTEQPDITSSLFSYQRFLIVSWCLFFISLSIAGQGTRSSTRRYQTRTYHVPRFVCGKCFLASTRN